VRDCRISRPKSEVVELSGAYQYASNLPGGPVLYVWPMIVTRLCQRQPVTFCAIMCSCAEQVHFLVRHVLIAASDAPPTCGAAAGLLTCIVILPAV